MFPAVAGAAQPRIAMVTFINFAAIKIDQPRFNSPSRSKYRHHVLACAGLDVLVSTFVIKHSNTTFDPQVVPIGHYGKAAMNFVPATAIRLQHLWEPDPYVFLARSLSVR